MPQMTCNQDAYCWTEWDDREKRFNHKTLRRGETGEVPDAEVARHDRIVKKHLDDHLSGRHFDHRAGQPRLVPADEYDEYVSEVAAASLPENQFTDEQIQSWGADDAIAQMNQVPGLAQRVLEIENERKPRRKAVVAFAERVIAAAEGEDVSLARDESAPETLTPAEGA